jgi:hypothetical protein
VMRLIGECSGMLMAGNYTIARARAKATVRSP